MSLNSSHADSSIDTYRENWTGLTILQETGTYTKQAWRHSKRTELRLRL